MELPDQHDLIALFESEPKSDAPGSPWKVAKLEFTYGLAEDRLEILIYAPSALLKICWTQNGVVKTNVEFRQILTLTTHLLENDEFLSASKKSGELLKLRVKPEISIEITHIDEI